MTNRFNRAVAAAICLILLAPPAFGSVDVGVVAGFGVNSRTGLFPKDDTSNDLYTSQLTLSPSLQLSLATRRVRFAIDYRLRLSNSIADERAFRLRLMNQAVLSKNVVLTRTLNWSSQVNASIGILDFSSALFLFNEAGDLAANRPDSDEFRYYSVGASTSFTKRFDRRSTGTVTATYRTRRPYGYDDEDEMPFSGQDQGSLGLGYDFSLTQLDTLTADASGGFIKNDPGTDYIPIRANLGLRHLFPLESTLSISIGIMSAHEVTFFDEEDDETAPSDQDENARHWLPLGSISYSKQVFLRNRTTLTGTLTGGLSPYFDQVRVSIRQRGSFGSSLTLSLPSQWTLSAQYRMATLLTPNSAGDNGPNNLYDTTASVNVGATYPVTDEIELSFGVISSARWTHLWESEVDLTAFDDFFFYINLNASKDIVN